MSLLNSKAGFNSLARSIGNLPPEIRRPYQLTRYSNIREAGIVFLGGKCEVCGTDQLLEFDHVDTKTKLYNLSHIWTNGRKFFAELNKCQLLCINCHKLKTRASNSVDHGEGASGKKNCKCIPCKTRKAEYMRVRGSMYRENKRLRMKESGPRSDLE